MCYWVAGKVTHQRKIWQDRICPNLRRIEKKGKLLKGETDGTGGRESSQGTVEFMESSWQVEWSSTEAVLLGEFQGDRLKAEQVDIGKNRKNRESEGARGLEFIGRVSLRPSRAIQSLRAKPGWINRLGEEFQPEELSRFSIQNSKQKKKKQGKLRGWKYSRPILDYLETIHFKD